MQRKENKGNIQGNTLSTSQVAIRLDLEIKEI